KARLRNLSSCEGMQLTFGAGSVPCKEQHTISTEIELAWPMTQVGAFPFGSPSRVRCSVFWSPFSPWQFFADDPQPKSITPGVGFGVSPSMCSRHRLRNLATPRNVSPDRFRYG